MRSVNISEVHENLAQLLVAVEAGEEILITRRDHPIARLVLETTSTTPFISRARLRNESTPMKETAADAIRALRDEECY